MGTALRARGIFLAELAENNVPRLTRAARGAFERHDDVAAELQNRTIAELFFRSLDKRFESYRVASKAEWCDRPEVLVARAVVSTRVLHPAHFAPETINPNRKIFEARKRETAALGAGEKLVLGTRSPPL